MKTSLPCQRKTTNCNGKDVRWVRPRRMVRPGMSFFDVPKQTWCEGCRKILSGAFKYVVRGDE